MSQKLPVLSEKKMYFLLMKNLKSIKTYDEESNIGYIFEADVEYPKNL